MKTSTQTIEKDGILATRLCSHTKDADVINETKLKELPGESRFFQAQDSQLGSSMQFEQQTSVPSKLELKIGAQVRYNIFVKEYSKYENIIFTQMHTFYICMESILEKPLNYFFSWNTENTLEFIFILLA